MTLSIRGARVLALAASLLSAEMALGQIQQQPQRRPPVKPSQIGASNPNKSAIPAKRPGVAGPTSAARPGAAGTTTRPTPSPATRPEPKSSALTETKKSAPAPAARNTETAKANTPSIKTALEYQPVQSDIEIDTPGAAEVDKCAIEMAENLPMGSGWTVRDQAGQTLRNFIDTNGDKYVDMWCYYKDGVEVYRDIDSNFNGKPDQCRWLSSAGSRWGLDRDEDGRIDSWKTISAEEVTSEVVAALRDRDLARFQRLLLTASELDSLGVGPDLAADLAKKIDGASKRFREAMASQSAVGADTKWLYFGGTRPGVVPAGTAKSSNDLLVYENVSAMIETAGKPSQIAIGALVRVGDTWRMVDAPPEGTESMVFYRAGQGPKMDAGATSNPNDPSVKERELLDKIAELENQIAATGDVREQGRLVLKEVELLEELIKIASTPQVRYNSQRQLIDTLAANAQSGALSDGADRLRELARNLGSRPEDAELAAHALFSAMLSDYTKSLNDPNVDYAKVQKQWMEDLEDYVKSYSKSPDLAEALLQLAQAQEFAGNEADALGWYGKLAQLSGESIQQKKGEGARRRLECVGKSVPLVGKDINGRKVDLADPAYRGKLVLVHYWDSNSPVCKRDLPLLEKMLQTYGPTSLAIIGVSVDSSAQNLRNYLAQNPLPWPQVFEEGGLENRLATEMGILTLPTMVLIDKQGNVLDRAIQAEDLQTRLAEVLPRVARKK